MSRFVDLLSTPARSVAGNAGNHVPDFAAPQNPPGTRLIRLDSNENPFGPSPHAIAAVHSAAATMHAYPDDDCIALRRKLAGLHEVRPEQILISAGSSGVLSLLCQTLLGPGLNAVTSALSFIVYGMLVRAVGARLIETPMRNDGFDLDAILRAINADTRIVFLANPNNPTGTMLEAGAIEKFLNELPPHVVVVLDGAYYEFASHFAALRKLEYSRALDYVGREERVVALRTFSKAHGLAGLRIGYGLGPAELLGYCARMANTYSVSSVAQAAALAALDDPSHIESTVSNNTAQAQILFDELSNLGYRTVSTAANFIYFDAGEDASNFAARLREENVVVRPLNAWGAPNGIRVTIGTPEQNQMFLQAMKRVSRDQP
jgi:histidinol-phosphate aminotransferase